MNKKTTKTILAVIVIVCIIGAIVFLESLKPARPDLGPSKKNGQLAPELAGISGWINTEPFTLASLRGKVVMVDFWTYTCVNCERTTPHLNEWFTKYRDDGFVIVGVHTPEFEFEKKIQNVRAAVWRSGIMYPVALDNNYATWSAYQNQYWPRKYLIDADGYIRYDHIGEGGYEETEEQIQLLLKERGAKISENISFESARQIRGPISPETYAGYGNALPRGQTIGNKGGYVDGIGVYELPATLLANRIFLSGTWNATAESLGSVSSSSLTYIFTASEVNLVMGNVSADRHVAIYLNSVPIGSVALDGHRLYTLYNGTYMSGNLSLLFDSDIEIHAFTFG